MQLKNQLNRKKSLNLQQKRKRAKNQNTKQKQWNN